MITNRSTATIKNLLVAMILYVYFICTLYYFSHNTRSPPERLPSILAGSTNKIRSKQDYDSLMSEIKEVKPVGYALALDYYQQQMGAAINLFNLQTWAAVTGVRVVEPFAVASKLVLPHNLSLASINTALRFSDYFNIDRWNQLSTQDHVMSLSPWEEFVSNKPYQLVIVIIIHKSTGQVVWENEAISHSEDCNNKLSHFYNVYKYGIQEELKATVVREVCFTFGSSPNESLTMKEFNYHIYGEWRPHQVSTWFTCWPGIIKGKMSITDPQYQLSSKPYTMIQRSVRVNKDSTEYATNNLRPNYTAISIRTIKPWMILSKTHNPDYVKTYFLNCIRKVGEVLNEIQSSEHIYGNPYLAIDLGRYGDMSAKKMMDQATMKLLLEEAIKITYNKTSIDEWERSITAGCKDKGYIAAVQAAIVEDADCIIMVGGYSRFQQNILQNYYQNNLNKRLCIHRVCYH